MNVHLLNHLTKCVRNWGPLWAYSCFQFESANNHLKKLFHGSKDMSKQVNRCSYNHFTICIRVVYIDPGDLSCDRQSDMLGFVVM